MVRETCQEKMTNAFPLWHYQQHLKNFSCDIKHAALVCEHVDHRPAPDLAPCRPGCIWMCGWRVLRSACRWGCRHSSRRPAGAASLSGTDLRGTYLRWRNRRFQTNIQQQKSAEAHKQTHRPTSSWALPEELLNDLCLGVVAVVFCHCGTQLSELSEEAVLVLRLTQLGRQRAALAHFSGRRRRSGAEGGAAGLRSWRDRGENTFRLCTLCADIFSETSENYMYKNTTVTSQFGTVVST